MKTVTIPVRSIWSAIIVLGIAGFAYIQAIGYIIPGFKEIWSLTPENISIQDFGLIWVPIVSYTIIACFVCFGVRIFKELKTIKEKGLVAELIWGLVAVLIVVLIWGFLAVLVPKLVVGLVAVLIWGPVAELICGLVAGLVKEFRV